MIFCARARFALPLFVFLSFGVAPSAEAAVFNVDTFDDELNFDGDCSLREAIQAANLDVGVDGCGIGSGADLIQLPAGNYPLTLTLPGDDDLNQVGDLDIRSDITLRGIGATQSVIDSQVFGGSRVLHVRCSDSLVVDIDVLIENVTLKGGAVLASGAGILIEDCTDGSSTAKSNVEINDVVLQTNITGSYGGGIADQTIGFVTIRNSLFYQNAVFESSFDGPGWGGGISIEGGGLTTIEDCVFEANSVFAFSFDTFGGAIYVSSPTNIRRSLIVNNSAFELGGAIYCVNTAMNLDNTTVVDNVAGFDGGGFFSGPGCLGSLDSVTITGSNNEGIFLGGGTVTLRNSIIANNANGIGDIVGAPTSNDYNIIGVIDGYTGTIAPNDLFGTAASPLDPGLGPLAFNGLPMRSMWPISSGAAGDSGDTPKIEDQFGNPRPANGVDDRGAVELQHSADYRDFYIDLGTESGTPSPAYAAAAGVAGVWNGIGLGNYALVDRGGNPSTVDVTVASAQDVFFGSSSIDDESKLLGDEIYDCTGAGGGGAWSLSFTGLQKSPYRVYLYAPERDPISSGEILLDPGAPLPALPAITGGEFALIENGTYQSEPILVLGGSLTISGLQPAGANCAGLAGVQLIPEPDSVTGIGSGSILLLMLARRRKTGAFSDRGRPSS